MSIVDLHNHAIPTQVLDLFGRNPAYGVQLVDGEWHGPHHVPFVVADAFCDPNAKLAEMDRAGVDIAVLSAPPPLFFYEIAAEASAELCEAANEGLRRFCAQNSDRFRWLAHLPMQAPELAADAYCRAVESGASGAALGTSIAGQRLDHDSYATFWRTAESVGRPVLLHPAFNQAHAALDDWYLQNAIGNPLETTVAVERLLCAGVLHRHPGLRLILLHAGGYLPYQLGRLLHARSARPELARAPEDLAAPLTQLYFDTITHDPDALEYLVRKVGAQHVVLGTDLPFDMGVRRPLVMLRKLFDDETLRTITEANPQALLGEAVSSGQRS